MKTMQAIFPSICHNVSTIALFMGVVPFDDTSNYLLVMKFCYKK
jgi:hypothetical protein